VYAVSAVYLLAPQLRVSRRLRVRPGLLSDQRSVRAVRGGLVRGDGHGRPARPQRALHHLPRDRLERGDAEIRQQVRGIDVRGQHG